MKKEEIKWAITSVILLGFIVLFSFAFYARGQKDAILGKQRYEMRVIIDTIFIKK